MKKKKRTLEALIRQLEGLASPAAGSHCLARRSLDDPTSRELLDLAVERVYSAPIAIFITPVIRRNPVSAI